MLSTVRNFKEIPQWAAASVFVERKFFFSWTKEIGYLHRLFFGENNIYQVCITPICIDPLPHTSACPL